MSANAHRPSPPAEGEVRAAQVNPGWAWYRIDQNSIAVALIHVEKGPPLTEKWYYGASYLEPSADHPEGVALTFFPVTQSEFESLRVKINVQKAFKHTLEPLIETK